MKTPVALAGSLPALAACQKKADSAGPPQVKQEVFGSLADKSESQVIWNYD